MDEALVRAEHMRGRHELVAVARGSLGMRVGALERRAGIGRPLFLRTDQAPPGALDPLPAVVAVHRPEAAHDAADPGAAPIRGLLHARDEAKSGRGTGVAAIRDRMHDHARTGEPARAGEVEDRLKMPKITVHEAITAQSEHVHAAAGGHGVIEGRLQAGVGGEATVADRARDPHEFLVHDPSGTDVLVADLAVAHDRALGRLRQADVLAARADEGARPLMAHRGIERAARAQHGIAGILLGVRIAPPAIPDHEDDRCVHGP